MALSTPFCVGFQQGAEMLNESRLILQFMLPNSHNTPSALPKNAPHANIAHPIRRNLPPPIGFVAFGHSQMLWATMPKAAVNKHGDTFFLKNEVRLPR
jgi:hypothetical protein